MIIADMCMFMWIQINVRLYKSLFSLYLSQEHMIHTLVYLLCLIFVIHTSIQYGVFNGTFRRIWSYFII